MNVHEVHPLNQIPGDRLERAVRSLLNDNIITNEQADDVRWFYQWMQGNNMSLSAGGKASDLSATSIYRLFTASYTASYDGIITKISKFRKLTEARALKLDVGFIETNTWRKIDAVCTQALNMQLPAFIYGASQIGKTSCLLEFQRRNNHGTTKYVRMPAAPTFSYFIKSLAAACYIHSNKPSPDTIRDRICNTLSSRNLLIIDEFHQALVTVTDRRAAQIMEFIREVYDRTNCGIVLCATKVGEREIERGRNAGIYDQLRRRGMVKLVLPDTPPASDVNRIAKTFDLEPPTGTAADSVKRMLAASGVGMYIKYLQASHILAEKRGEKLTWDTFLSVNDGMEALATH